MKTKSKTILINKPHVFKEENYQLQGRKLIAMLLMATIAMGTINLSLAILNNHVLVKNTGTILAKFLWDSCDEIGKWKTASSGTVQVNITDKIEGIASLKMSYSAGWEVLFYKDGLWDLSVTPVFKFRFKAHNPLPTNFRFGIITGAVWNGYKYNISSQVIVGEWTTVTVDLRQPLSGIPDLTNVIRVEFSCWDQYVQAGSFSIDFIELLPGPPIPLTATISPALPQFVLINGTSITFDLQVLGGISPYTYEWFVNNSKQAETRTFTYSATQLGLCTVHAKVTDSNGEFKLVGPFNVTVLEKYTLPEPRALHTEGALIYNDLNQTVHLRGVHSVNFGDSSTGWFIGGSTTLWSETIVEKNLEVLESWGCNFLYLSGIDFDRLVNNTRYPSGSNIGIMDAVKSIIELAYEHGIYVAIGIDNWVLQDTAEPQYVWYWAPAHLDEWVNGWLNISQQLRQYPNVLYGMNAEPAISETAMDAYFNATVAAIRAIRDDGDEHIFFYHEDYCEYPVRFDKPATQGGEMIRKLHEQNITNIVYSGHIYRWHGTFGGNPDYFDPNASALEPGYVDYDGVYTYEDIIDALTYWGYRKILDKYQVPIIMGEGGSAKASRIKLPNTWEKELTAYRNLLQILNEWGVGYACFWWRQPGTEGPVFSPLICPDQTDFIPNEWGQVLIYAART